ncbi:hypothetical protein F2P56_033823 [Juglans regia]|uniref:PGG domain-containing protein n=2 Tax=Juglans regia TaxID=51240 RepID=A0A833X7G1_JUGRE|nr:hypothetical protein F2P56_033823 [Juglans regia]
MLARKPSAMGSKSTSAAGINTMGKMLSSCFKGLMSNRVLANDLVEALWKDFGDHKNFSSTSTIQNHMKILVEAAKVGNVEFIKVFIRSYPDLIWQVDEEYGSLFHVAVKHRQESVFNLIYETGVMKTNLATYIDKEGNNMLHLAAELPSPNRLNIVSGAALQMQREMLWFQEIKKIMPNSYVIETNKKGQTPKEIFMKSHEDLQKKGEKWMKGTANYCMLVAALIATVVFPAAFTVPGGNNQDTGIPIFLETNWFRIFFISDAVAMLFSSSSVLVFLSVLTSRYTEKDFIKTLPQRLALGLGTLLISIVAMLLAFTAASFLVFQCKTPSVPIGIIVAAPVIPISLFVMLHYALWFDIFRSAFISNLLFRSQHKLFEARKEWQSPVCMQLRFGTKFKQMIRPSV